MVYYVFKLLSIHTHLQLYDFGTNIFKWNSSICIFIARWAKQSGNNDVWIVLAIHCHMNLVYHVRPYNFRSEN